MPNCRPADDKSAPKFAAGAPIAMLPGHFRSDHSMYIMMSCRTGFEASSNPVLAEKNQRSHPGHEK
ncbi:MAG: hypothetical protein CTY20_09415 [Hyphomicrobium sp.]|nr:MAG: hypothetical protein CTY20_09415 [Hyphomicrobium sp.]